MQQYHLQFGKKWKAQWIYAAQQRLHLAAIANLPQTATKQKMVSIVMIAEVSWLLRPATNAIR